MKIKVTRDELKRQAELLGMLEHFEMLAQGTSEYSQASVEFKMRSSQGTAEHTFDLDPHARRCRGPQNTLRDKIDAIVEAHFSTAMSKVLELIKSELSVELDR